MRPAVFITVALCALPIAAQQAEYEVIAEGYRSLRPAMWLLREKTGWRISYEEPVWPPKASPGLDAHLTIGGFKVEPPLPDRLKISISSIRGSTRADVVSALLGAYNSQNNAVLYRSELLGDMTVIEADTIQGPAGARGPAPLILSTVVDIPTAARTPTEHLEALASALQQRTGVPVQLDTGLGPYDIPFTGKNGPFRSREDMLFNWGAASCPARLALLDLLGRSMTSTVYELACQVGINSPGECTLALRPLVVEVTSRSGKLTKRTLYFDRGRPDVITPPPPE